MQLPVMMIGKIMRIMAWFHKNFKTVPPHIRIFIQFISNFYSVFIQFISSSYSVFMIHLARSEITDDLIGDLVGSHLTDHQHTSSPTLIQADLINDNVLKVGTKKRVALIILVFLTFLLLEAMGEVNRYIFSRVSQYGTFYFSGYSFSNTSLKQLS